MRVPFVRHDCKILIGITLMCYSNLMPNLDRTIAETLPFCPTKKMLSLHSLVAYGVREDGHVLIWRQLFMESHSEATEVEAYRRGKACSQSFPVFSVVALGPFKGNVTDVNIV